MVPEWTYKWLGVSAFVYVAQFLVCGTALLGTTGSFLDILLEIIGFTACAGLPGWVSFAAFMLISLPGLIILATMLIQLAQGSTAGLVVVALLTVAIAAVGFF